MLCRWYALLALLTYATLDVSLPAMPGAFVVEADESVQSARMSRRSAAGDVRPLTAPRPRAFTSLPRIADPGLPRPASRSSRIAHGMLGRLPRAALTPAAPSEDPQ